MTYPYISPDQYSAAGYGAYWPPGAGVANRRKPWVNQLIWVVLLLGLATYLVSYAAVPHPSGLGWGVRFSAFAAIVAALGLLPRQSAQTKAIVALAVMGFLDALSQLIITDQNPNWATIVIPVLTGLQALTAIAARLAELGTLGGREHEPGPYDAYAYYAQAAQQYYAANAQQVQQHAVQGQGTAPAEATAAAQAQQSEAERYALYAEYLNAQRPGPNPAVSSPHSHSQPAQPAAGTGIPTSGPTESIRPRSDPGAGSAGQSWPS